MCDSIFYTPFCFDFFFHDLASFHVISACLILCSIVTSLNFYVHLWSILFDGFCLPSISRFSLELDTSTLFYYYRLVSTSCAVYSYLLFSLSISCRITITPAAATIANTCEGRARYITDRSNYEYMSEVTGRANETMQSCDPNMIRSCG